MEPKMKKNLHFFCNILCLLCVSFVRYGFKKMERIGGIKFDSEIYIFINGK